LFYRGRKNTARRPFVWGKRFSISRCNFDWCNRDFAQKLATLNENIALLGEKYAGIDLTKEEWAYNLQDGSTNRKELNGLNQSCFPGVILPSRDTTRPCEKKGAQ
jgi:hypothetical protein